MENYLIGGLAGTAGAGVEIARWRLPGIRWHGGLEAFVIGGEAGLGIYNEIQENKTTREKIRNIALLALLAHSIGLATVTTMNNPKLLGAFYILYSLAPLLQQGSDLPLMLKIKWNKERTSLMIGIAALAVQIFIGISIMQMLNSPIGYNFPLSLGQYGTLAGTITGLALGCLRRWYYGPSPTPPPPGLLQQFVHTALPSH